MEFRKSLSQILEEQIKFLARNIRQFSEKSGIPYMTISDALKKGVENSSFGTIIKICNALGIAVTDLFYLQAMDTIVDKMKNSDYSNDDLLDDLLETKIIRPEQLRNVPPDKVENYLNNLRFFYLGDWI